MSYQRATIPSSDRTLSVARLIQQLKQEPRFRDCITHVAHFPARSARFKDFPDGVASQAQQAFQKRGIDRLFCHQAEAFEKIHAGNHVVVVTPTASGKTLCYNLPTLSAILTNPDVRALYLFPTKALAQDQMEELNQLILLTGREIKTFTYDGDTPQDARRAIRAQGHVVVTNPDMLHSGILPHHTKWAQLFENLKYVVVDELHTYRGVFGSHTTNVLRRLKRICQFYGSQPQFICCSATIANPQELAARLIEEEVELIDDNGAPQGDKYFLFYNPPVVNPSLGIRRSYVNETRSLASEFLRRRLQTIIFANSRLVMEVLLTYLKESRGKAILPQESVRGYRGGYLPLERRAVEKALREGRLLGVVATNALELGVDIGSLQASIMAGYSGTIASTWQRAGRAGRRNSASLAILVANSSPLDQFIIQHPEYFFGQSPEHGLINPDNLEILLNHMKCALFELPFSEGDKLGNVAADDILRFLEGNQFAQKVQGKWHWTSESYPADAISLRAVSSDNFVVLDITDKPKIMSKVDFPSALTTLHEKAIYLHEGKQYFVEMLDYKERRAHVKRVESDYFTDAISYTKVKVLETFESQGWAGAIKNHGEIHLTTQVVGFKKIKFHTLENVGAGDLELPQQEMHTTAYWLTLPKALMDSLPYPASARLSGVRGLAYAMRHMARLFLMCDLRDLSLAIEENLPAKDLQGLASGEDRPGRAPAPTGIFEPNIFLYDNYPGGIGLSQPLYDLHQRVLGETLQLITGCPCQEGCPSCIGPRGETGHPGKAVALDILAKIN